MKKLSLALALVLLTGTSALANTVSGEVKKINLDAG